MQPIKVGISILVVVLMIPGLIIEPGPISEVAGISVLLGIWGIGDGEEVSD
jgi:hypothetical protein